MDGHLIDYTFVSAGWLSLIACPLPRRLENVRQDGVVLFCQWVVDFYSHVLLIGIRCGGFDATIEPSERVFVFVP